MLNNVVIICDGKFPKTEYPRYLIRTADHIVCCDGALKKFLRASEAIFGEERLPDLVTGDMDSLPAAMQKKYADIIIPEGGFNQVALEMLTYRIHALLRDTKNI
jgi:thiamine pyrophosphokinase